MQTILELLISYLPRELKVLSESLWSVSQHQQLILWVSRHQLGAQWMGSILTLNRLHSVKYSAPLDCLSSHQISFTTRLYFCQNPSNISVVFQNGSQNSERHLKCLPIYYDGYDSEAIKWKRGGGQGMGAEDARSFHVLLRQPLSGYLGMFTTQQVRQVSSLNSFYRA